MEHKMVTLYHSTIKARLASIMLDGLKPGMAPIDSELDGYFDYLEFPTKVYPHHSSKHVYAWRDLEYAKEVAIEKSSNADREKYSEEERIPVVIPFPVEEDRVSPDEDSRGVKVLGIVKPVGEAIIIMT